MKKTCFVCFLLFLGSTIVSAQVPGTLSYQGILMQSDGITPIADGAHSIVFSFYTVPSAGSALFTRTISGTTAKGLYSCIIGGGTAPNAPFNATEMNQIGSQQIYIGVNVDAGGELSPRAQLTPGAYSFHTESISNTSNPAGGNVAFWASNNRVSSDAGFFWDNSNKSLGIGTATPATELHVKGNDRLLRLEGTDHCYLEFYPDGPATRKAYFGFEDATDNSLSIRNEISGEDIVLATGGNVVVGNSVIESTGFIGIGTTNPGLEIDIYQTLNDRGLRFRSPTTPTEYWDIGKSNGGGFVFNLNGGSAEAVIATNGTYSPSSDRRLKENFAEVTDILPKILQLRPMTYNFKSDLNKERSIGLIAQEVLPLFPESVKLNKSSGYYHLSTADFGILSIQGIKELHAIVQDQQSQIETLRAKADKMDQLSDEVAALKKLLTELVESKIEGESNKE